MKSFLIMFLKNKTDFEITEIDVLNKAGIDMRKENKRNLDML